MGIVVSGGLQGLTLQHYAQAGVEEYTEIFRAPTTQTDDAFGGLLNQEESLDRFVESLALDMRGRLNLGAAGVGKTTCVQSLFAALEKLDRGEEVTGKYAEQIKAYHKKLRGNPRGEIVAFWNPKDYYKPIFFRARDSNATLSLEEVIGERNTEMIKDVYRECITIAKKAQTYEILFDCLSNEYAQLVAKRSSARRLEWSVQQRPGSSLHLTYRKGVTPALRKKWGDIVRSNIALNSVFHQRDDVRAATRDILLLGKDALENTQPHRQENHARAEEEICKRLDAWSDELEREGDVWKETEPEVMSWYASVAAFLRNDRHRESLLESIWSGAAGFAPAGSRNARRSPGRHELDEEEFTMRVADKDHSLVSLLRPSRKRAPAGDKLVIRSPTVQSAMDLFISEEDMDEKDQDVPLHHQVALGDLAYADVLFIDDGLADLLTMKELRQALLTYLSEGRISVADDKIQIECNSHCQLFACETANPFQRQIYQGTEPEHDDGMERRFAITQWSNITEHTPKTVASFPTLVARTTKEVRTTNGRSVRFDPEALNLLYHHFLSRYEPSLLFPLTVGQMSKELFQPIAARVGGQGREVVTAADIRKFFDTERNEVKRYEEYLVNLALAQHPLPGADWLVGHANGLYAGDDLGGAFHLTAAVADAFSPITSADDQAELTEETFSKGLRMTDAWLHKTFGPLRVGVQLSNNMFSKMGGPSSSAVNTYATLSALGEIPLDQNTYATGTVLDLEGHVGVIGGAFEKIRGALQYHRKRFGGTDVPTMRVLIPENNVRAFMRQTVLDEQVEGALRDGTLEVRTHNDVWEGFSQFSGLAREEWEPRVRERIEQLTNRILEFERRLRGAGSARRTGRRVHR